MKGFKKAAAYVVGSMVIAVAGVYFALPKEAKQSVKDFIGNLRSGKKNSCNCCDECTCHLKNSNF